VTSILNGEISNCEFQMLLQTIVVQQIKILGFSTPASALNIKNVHGIELKVLLAYKSIWYFFW
jgi:hypothetical protein